MDYNPKDIEPKWRKHWKENEVYKVSNDSDKPKFYVLDMFPYPSGAGLHVGHPLGYIASDIFARYKRKKGFNVLHPMGYDAFGLPAEQYAVTMGVHPAESTAKNIARYREQFENMGFSFDWDREINTSNSNYYKWTQWIFLEIFGHYYDNDVQRAIPISELVSRFEKEGNANVNAATTQDETFDAATWNGMTPKQKDDVLMNYRLAYRKVGYVNWCEELGTVLANDEVKDGVSERGGYPVEKRPMLQWSLRITSYAERLLLDLETVEWTESLKTMQRNWIGRSEGAQMFFNIEGTENQIEIFTTRPDTIFGATYMVLAPEHDLVSGLTTADQQAAINDYLTYVKSRSERERTADVKTVTGAFTGSYAINPFSNARVPIWIGEYVLKDYGTGAIMAVPSDDDRDYSFAEKFELEIIDVIDKSKYPGATRHDKLGVMINSDFLNGMEVPDAIEEMLKRIEVGNLGKRKVNYKLRDANYSRQRYWGEPVPVTYDKDGVASAMSVDQLPLELPFLDNFKPGDGGQSPLSRLEDWVNLEDGVTRETDTMPGYAGSSWYFLRYMDAGNPDEFASKKALNYWKDVDLYVGGTEHAVGHLMYSRFWHKFLFDKGLVPTSEPYRKLINQGMIQGVIEFIYLNKEKKDGYSHFVCTNLAPMIGVTDYARIPIHVDFVSNYGSSDSYIDMNGIRKFIEWRPDYKDAIFECGNGTFHKGEFLAKNGKTDNRMTTHSEVGKMSKRYFNVVNPDDVIDRYGTDCFRMYEMFLGPIEQSKPWDTKGIDGVSKFLRKFWNLFFDEADAFNVSDETPTKAELKALHSCIKKVNYDVERFAFNTCVSAFMECTNELRKLNCNKKGILEPLVNLLSPFAPHVTEELWHRIGNETTVNEATFPVHDEAHLVESTINYPVCINGKKRTEADFPADAAKETIEKATLEMEVVQKWLDGKTVRKVIVVPKRMINIVVS